ncbi:MAG TPA: HAMP domain-containing sensor histidine kinase [Dinghuibacter sp.]|jgi:signal transduction histidine kinase|uniref:sensor histidine kinase n=1 Tax=Dinghuibacter sp. TaxID=2024697 RepID=UPI002D10DC13|nr:HAMP domain-containing sensor histidine kinase [Dinghuibacter sp.]HTJ13196.1 HAMP domain-containing sensor histidine kinase [Dinghuibacter sp.]
MIFRRYEWSILVRVGFLFGTLVLLSYEILRGQTVYEVILGIAVLWQLGGFYRFNKKIQTEVEQFVEAVQYRDFSRHFDVRHAPAELQPLRKGFNELNHAFKVISNEKETQYQYLQKILELVNTGILSYEISTGDVVWMNEALRNLLQIPYLKTIHALSKRDWSLYHEIMSLPLGENVIATAHTGLQSYKLLLSATAFQTEGRKYKLIAFQNVNEALDETESKAWQKLLSVMTHEIMNSVAPISSLADTLGTRLSRSLPSLPPALEDLAIGIETIKKRSEGLLKFAETYRNLNKITTLNIKRVYVRDVFENLHHLMAPTLEAKQIELEVILKDPSLILEADTSLVEQVLINLIVNAVEAVRDASHPRITLNAMQNASKKTLLKVADNGSGMPEEIMDKIFIPFFSTKRNGSGIGLSLAKQIMMLHKGNIQVQSAVGEGTVFTLQF